MFASKPNYLKLRINLRLCINRLKLLEKKKTELALKARREIADYILAGKDDRARIRVEHIIREDYLVEATEIVEMLCDLLLARFGLIERMSEFDLGIEEAVATLIWVAPRLSGDIQEIREVLLIIYTMSKKRTSSESNNDEERSEDSETPVQREGNAKREKLDSRNDTTLQDLPFELLECILFEAVVMEVNDLKLVKSVWKEKADLVINRLGTVCSQWDSILTTKSFRTKLKRVLDDTAQTFRLDILHECPTSPTFRTMTTLKDEIFMLCKQSMQYHVIYVFNRNDMEDVKEVIPVPGAIYITGCNVSNCVYVSVQNKNSTHSILRVSKDVEGEFKILPWESDHKRSIDMIRISTSGCLMILSKMDGHRHHAVVSIYNANGSLQHEVILSNLDGSVLTYENLLLKSTGNLVVAYVIDQTYSTRLTEIDMSGSVIRQYVSLDIYANLRYVNFADDCGRIMVVNTFEEIELLDSDFSLLGIYCLQQDADKQDANNVLLGFDRPDVISIYGLHYNSEWNEIACICHDKDSYTSVLTTFCFTEE